MGRCAYSDLVDWPANSSTLFSNVLLRMPGFLLGFTMSSLTERTVRMRYNNAQHRTPPLRGGSLAPLGAGERER